MKIIERGDIKPKSKKCTCYKCKSKLEYTNDDIKTDRDGDYIVCPVCKTFITKNFML